MPADSLCLMLRAHLDRGGYHTDRYEARLDGELIVTTRQPLYDGARELLRQGYDPDRLLTMQYEGAAHRAWVPTPIGELAKWTVWESDRDGMRKVRWKPHPRAQDADSSRADEVENA